MPRWSCTAFRTATPWAPRTHDARGLAHGFHDFKKQGVLAADRDAWTTEAGWEALDNWRGMTWQKLDPAARDAVVDGASAAALLRSTPGVIKRRLVRWPAGALTVGFDKVDWAARV